MLSNLVSMFSKSFMNTSAVVSKSNTSVQSYNPFSSQGEEKSSPFLSTSFGSSASYGKNQPVQGGYFAGYYNGKPNIVGRVLFVEV